MEIVYNTLKDYCDLHHPLDEKFDEQRHVAGFFVQNKKQCFEKGGSWG